MLPRLLAAALLFAAAAPASAQFANRVGQAWYPIKGGDGTPVANHRVPVELESQIEKLPGAVVLGNPKGDVTLVEFYDLNCPYCRKASADIDEILRTDRELKLVLVPVPVLGVPSIQAGRVELVVALKGTAQQFYAFHRKVYAGRGTVDGAKALAVAKELGFDPQKTIDAANEDDVTEAMKAHVRLGNALNLMATPAYVVKGVAILGHPGRASLEKVIASIRRCDKVVC